ncbi:MAG: extracellular solute-binding protein [Halanaerobiales bacterium]
MAENKLKICLMSTIGQDELAYYKKRFSEFERKHDLEVIITQVSWNRGFSWLIDAFKKGCSPDIIQLGSTWVHTFASLGYLDPVPAAVRRPVLASWMEEVSCYQSQWVVQPWFVEIRALLVWNDILNQFDMDYTDIMTPDDFMTACHRLARERKEGNCRSLPFAFPIRPESEILHRYISWHMALGGEFPSLEPVSNKLLSRDSFAGSLNFFSGLAEVNRLPRSEMRKHPYELYRDFTDEACYVFYQGNWELRPGHGNEASDYTVMPLPILESGGRCWGGGSVLSVSSRSPVKDAAWRLVDFITSDDFVEPWVPLNGNMPAFRCKFWDKYRGIKNVQQGYHQILNSISYPPHPMWATVERLLSVGLSNYFWQVVEKERNTGSEVDIYSSLTAADKIVYDFLRLKWNRCVEGA